MHSHEPHLTATGEHRGRLRAVAGVVVVVVAAEVVGGVLSGNLTLLADAGHLATDAAGIGPSLLAIRYAGRPATTQRTFGDQRAEALVDDATVVAGSSGRVLDDLCDCLAHHCDVEPWTFQLEPAGHLEHERWGRRCG